MKQLLRIFTIVSLLATIGVFVAASPAAADRPETIIDVVTFSVIDPCTGLPDVVTETLVIKLHEHNNVRVVTIKQTAETTLGYVASGGQTVVNTGDRLNVSLNIMSVHPATGARLKVSGQIHWNFADGPPQVAPPELTCIRPGTQP